MRRPALSQPRLAAPRDRRGFGLVEGMFAIVVTGIAAIGLAGMLVSGARSGNQISLRSGRTALVAQQLNRLASLPYEALDAQAGCVAVSTPPQPHTRCISVTSVAGGLGAKEIRLIITLSAGSLKPDTTYITRSKGASASPLGT